MVDIFNTKPVFIHERRHRGDGETRPPPSLKMEGGRPPQLIVIYT